MLNILNLICAILLFVAVVRLPIAYYHLLRIVVFYGAFLTFFNIKENYLKWSFAFLAMAILYNPFLPFSTVQKFYWIPIDILSGILFLLTFYFKEKGVEEGAEARENKLKPTHSRDRIAN